MKWTKSLTHCCSAGNDSGPGLPSRPIPRPIRLRHCEQSSLQKKLFCYFCCLLICLSNSPLAFPKLNSLHSSCSLFHQLSQPKPGGTNRKQGGLPLPVQHGCTLSKGWSLGSRSLHPDVFKTPGPPTPATRPAAQDAEDTSSAGLPCFQLRLHVRSSREGARLARSGTEHFKARREVPGTHRHRPNRLVQGQTQHI